MCYNANTEHSADSPELGVHRHPAGGVPRYNDPSALVADLQRLVCEGEDEGRLLQMVLEHVSSGGIVIRHAGSLVLTWPDGGVSRRLAAGHWG